MDDELDRFCAEKLGPLTGWLASYEVAEEAAGLALATFKDQVQRGKAPAKPAWWKWCRTTARRMCWRIWREDHGRWGNDEGLQDPADLANLAEARALSTDDQAINRLTAEDTKLTLEDTLNRAGFDRGSCYWIPTSDWSACWAA